MLNEKDKNNIIVLSMPDKYKRHFKTDNLTYSQFMDDTTFVDLKKAYCYYQDDITNIDYLEDLVNCVAINWIAHCLLLKTFDKHIELLRDDIGFTRKHHFELMLSMMQICLEWCWDK